MAKGKRGQFKKGDPRTIELAKKGGRVKAERQRAGQEPYQGTVLDLMDLVGLTGDSWRPWRVFWKAVYGLDMTADEREIFRRHTDRTTPPTEPVEEAWMVIGRRGGKTRNAALGALHRAITFDPSVLAPGELAVVPLLAADKKQARALLGYLNGFLEMEDLAPYVHRTLRESVELNNDVNIEVHTASYRTIRGYTTPAVVCDEIAFWRTDDGSANPDSEILQALRPSMATVPNSVLLALSSPYAARGELYNAVDRSFGRDDPHVLVWNGSSKAMNPTLPDHVIERAFEEDPVAAASEYGSEGRVAFRRDVEAFLDPAAIRAVTVSERRELPRGGDTHYVAFCDPSGGSQDSMTLAIAHAEGEVGVLDLLREVRPPFSPDNVVEDFAAALTDYGIGQVTGDRYGGEWPAERFREHGITYIPSERTKSDIYREFVAPVNAGRVELLDVPVLRHQLTGLERRVARSGKDTIDHGPGGRDDVANAAAGALVLLQGATVEIDVWEEGFHW